MALDVRHRKVNPVADGPETHKVRPSDWNASHKLDMGDGKVVGRFVGSGPGEATELPIRVKTTGDVDMSSASFTKIASGLTSQRPGAPDLGPGALRHNSMTDRFEGAGNVPGSEDDEQWHAFLDERGGTFSGPVNEGKGENVASSGTVDLIESANFVTITGTVDITQFKIPEGAERVVVFEDVLTLDSNPNLLLPVTDDVDQDIETEAGDVAFVRGLEDDKAMVTAYTRKSGQPLRMPEGMVIQSVRASNNNHIEDHNEVIPYDNSAPENTEGFQVLTASITLKRPGSKVRVRAFTNMTATTSSTGCAALFFDVDLEAFACQFAAVTSNLIVTPIAVEGEHEPTGLGPHAYKLKLGLATAILWAMNGTQEAAGAGNRRGAGKMATSMTLEEIAVAPVVE